MRSVLEDVSELRATLGASADEHELLGMIKQKLRDLRAAYRNQKEDFSAEVVAFLKDVAALEGVLREFIDALDDMAWVRTRDDAQELATRFQELSERLRPHLVTKRAEKEVRELVERSKSLPFAAVAEADADYRRRLARLEQHAPVCHRCKNKMVLRESQHGLFWGCSSFPQCFARSWLTKAENAVLRDDR